MSSDEWVKALGIDYGTVRIGLAVSDDIGLMAHPLKTISGKPDDAPLETLCEIVKNREIRDIVMGMPYHSDGSESTMSKAAAKFLDEMKTKLSSEENAINFHQIDEWATTKTAREKLDAAGKKKKDITGVLDQAAAVEILQEWLDQRANAMVPDSEMPFPEFFDDDDDEL